MTSLPLPGHRQRVRKGRLLLALIFSILCGADSLLLSYSFHPANPLRPLIGLTLGSLLSTTTLIVCLWRRQVWSRIVLILFIIFFMTVASTPAVMALGQSEPAISSPYSLVLYALALYAGVAFMLVRSRSIRHLSIPPSSGG